ncbi:MAG: hypothetical protein BGN91_13800 [Nitrobacter sp. 62-13]|jgi:hypothetical protein|uniref:hypothetical protein n=1 Tax=Nitrobacter sp. 62-13 TaxID=1895797 RepID=UPI00095AF7DA|nr:hypothetical protein [Nitrobacter sp. 62-13]OJU30143.1 MAG: hypothetical protein BGN91_13800 [Nitrobacter sp. 62-13]
MKKLVLIDERTEGNDRGAFVLHWVENIVEYSIVTDRDGTKSRIAKPAMQQSKTERPYSDEHQRRTIEAELQQTHC